ncbi:hypothetical protein DV735_g875, partial [Chaetothyriales sp. CBS 134920]
MAAATGNSLLTTFQKHIDEMRGLTLCKICLRPFYEPFTLACGHTYCYSCLRDWLHGPRELRAEKGCPDCRQKIETEPSPNYTLRDLVHMFVNRVELLPEDESVEEHERGKHAEAKVLADDRKGNGVFRGMFKRTRLPLFGFDRAFRDAADGVDRCPKCMWEMEEGECNSCGWPRIDYSDDDFDSTEELEEPNSMDGFRGPPDAGPDGAIRHRTYGYSDAGTDQSADDFSGDEDEHDSELEDFIDDEDEDEDDYPAEIDHDDYPTEVEHDDYPTEIDHDDGLSEPTDTYDTYPPTNGGHVDAGLSTDTGSDDAQGLYERPVSARDRRARIIDTDMSQEEDESESGEASQGTNYDNDTDATPRIMAIQSFSGPWSEDENDLDGEGDGDDDNDDDPSVQRMPVGRATKRARTRRVIESDDDEDDYEGEGEGEIGGNISTYESPPSESTTTAQSAAHRLGRLQARRAHNSLNRYLASSASRSRSPPQATWRNALPPGNWARRGRSSTGGMRRRPENGAGAGAMRVHHHARVR